MEIKLKVNNQNLAATLITKFAADAIKPEGIRKPLPGLIFVHGWKSNQQGNVQRAIEISKLGFTCLTLDLRGHGQSAGTIDQFSRQDHLEDIKTAYKYLADLKEVDPKKIGIVGSSYGGYLSAVAVNYLHLNRLILRVPALYFDQGFDIPTDKLIKENPQAFTSSDLTAENCLALKGVANFPGEILLIESEKDEVISHPVIENYLKVIKDKKNLTYEIMKGAGHHFWNNPEFDEVYLNIVKKWLEEKS